MTRDGTAGVLDILFGMRSVADDLRTELQQRLLTLEPAERIDLALKLGDDDVSMLAAAACITPREAKRRLAAARAIGRIPSCANDLA